MHRSVRLRPRFGRALVLALTLPVAQLWAQAAPPSSAVAQPAPATTGVRKPLAVADYSRWRNIEGAEISGDGRWVTYTLRHTNTLPADSKPVLHILNLDTNQDVEVPNAHDGTFSPDSRWIVYQIDSVPAPRGRGGRGGGPSTDTSAATPPPPNPDPPATPGVPAGQSAAGRGGASAATPPRMELRELATGRTQRWQRMQSAAFSATSTHLLLRRRAAGGGGRGRGAGPAAPAAGGAANARGTDAVLHDLATSRSLFLGSVGDASFNRRGDLLAYTVDATVRDGNGLFVMELANGRMHVLDNDERIYARLSWSDDGAGIAVLKGREVERKRERDNVLMVFTDLRGALGNPENGPVVLDPSTAAGFPKDWVVSDRAPLMWSEDGRRVFFGSKPQMAAPDTGRRPSTDSIPDVDVWRTQDERIQSAQMIRAEADRNFTFRQAFDVSSGKYVALTDSTMRELELSPDGRWGVGRDTRGYVSDYKRPAADLYRVNTATGERTLMLKGQLIGPHVHGISPDGRSYLYWKDNRYQAYDLDAAATRTLGAGTNGTFVNMEYDYPGPKPSYGVAGYTSDGQGVIVHQKHDLWLLPLDGRTPARNLTNGIGSRTGMRLRAVRTQPIDSAAPRRTRTGREIDLSAPLVLSAYGEWTKKAGFYELANGQLRELVYEDAMFSTPQRAEKADRYLFTRQTFAEFPDLRVSGPGFREAKRITDANPHQAEYTWGRRILFDYRNRSGVRLQGILALPDDYQPGEKRPMLVSFYEKNSQNMHRYPTPSFLTGMGGLPTEALSRGYITMLADVHFRTGSSHSDMLDAVEAATRKVIELGYADPKRIGVHGHSYGGEGAAFIGTRSKLFAAVGMGAGVTDLYSDFSQSWGWSYQVTGGSGENGNGYYLYGQGRWGVSPWDAPDLYRFESALTHAPNASAPFLIMHGTADPTVAFTEGMNFYNALRYNGKTAVMLAYPGEGHGLRGLANRRDLTIRYFQFFDHYLKGAPAPKWMSDGVPYLVKDTMREPK